MAGTLKTASNTVVGVGWLIVLFVVGVFVYAVISNPGPFGSSATSPAANVVRSVWAPVDTFFAWLTGAVTSTPFTLGGTDTANAGTGGPASPIPNFSGGGAANSTLTSLGYNLGGQ